MCKKICLLFVLLFVVLCFIAIPFYVMLWLGIKVPLLSPICEKHILDQTRPSCTININGDLGEPQPLLIHPGTDFFFYPQGSDGIIHLEGGDEIELFCTSGFVNLAETQINSIIINCVENKTFYYNEDFKLFNEFRCNSYPTHTAQITGYRCFNNGIEIRVGFPVGIRFLPIYLVCHDEITDETYYVHHLITPSNIVSQERVFRPSWITGGFHGGKSVDNLYTCNTQLQTIAFILSSQSKANFYIHPTDNFYLSRGHLAAKTDFIFGSQQRATFYFINAAPQWQRFNNGNWKTIENGVKSFAAMMNYNLLVWTGTYGTLQLRDENENPCEIHLYVNGAVRQIPAPMIFYKIIVKNGTNEGIVLIGVNNLYEDLVPVKICHDNSNLINWINWNRSQEIDFGYIYACSVQNFTQVVRHIQLPDVTENLTH